MRKKYSFLAITIILSLIASLFILQIEAAPSYSYTTLTKPIQAI
jgi:hypothetical protein